MDKENGKVNEGTSGASSKLQDQTSSILDAANLFGAYWPRSDAATNLFGSSFGLSPHAAAAALPFGILPTAAAGGTTAAVTSQSSSGRNSGGGGGSSTPSSSSAGGLSHNLSTISSSSNAQSAGSTSSASATSSSSAAVAAAAAAAAYSNAAYSNTLSVAASQAASLGMPAASAAWWSMASHLAAQEYIQRLQATTGLNFPLGAAADPYGTLALANLTALGAGGVGLGGGGASGAGSGHHKSKNSSSKNSSRSNCKDKSGTNRRNDSSDHHHHHHQQQQHHHYNQHKTNSSASSVNYNKSSSTNSLKYSSASGLTIQPTMKLPPSSSTVHSNSSSSGSTNYYSGCVTSIFNNNSASDKSRNKTNISSGSISDTTNFLTKLDNNNRQKNNSNNSSSNSVANSSSGVVNSSISSSIFSNPLSLASTNTNSIHQSDKYLGTISIPMNNSHNSTTSTTSATNNNSGIVNSYSNSNSPQLPQSILSAALEGNSDPNSILGGVRLPPDTEIIKYTSSIVGPKIPGTTNRGRKKTISLDPPPSDEDMLAGIPLSDRVEVIKLPTTNGSINETSSNSEAPLNLSLKPNWSSISGNSNNNNINQNNNGSSTHLNSLSNMSVNIGTERIGTTDRISRRKPGPRPRRVVPMECTTTTTPAAPAQPPILNIPFNQFNFTTGLDSPRPPSRSEGSDGGSSTSSTSAIGGSGSGTLNHSNKEGRPRNLGRGVSKPKKNTVASLLAQSRALGIKPVPMLDPSNTSTMNQQMQLLRSNIMDAQRYISEVGGDEKALNKFLQEKFKGPLSDGSTVDASDSDNFTDSNHTDSELETEQVPLMKRPKHYDERLLRVPLEKGWRRETLIRGVTKTGGIKGDVTYSAPESTNKFKQMSDVTQYLEYQKNLELSKENFTFSCRAIIGDYLQPIPPEMQTDGTEYIFLTEEDVTKRLDELKAAMRTSIPVEQRIEMAKKQQAARAAARLDREQQRLNKELERNERQEAARREKEARTQQMLEAKRKRQEELEKQKQEEQQRKQQERELKRQQAAMLKEQEKERRRQHLALIKAMENRRKLEEKERRKQQLLAEKQANREKKLEQRKVDLEILAELRKPCEDLELNQNDLPEYERIPGVKLCGKAFADTLMVFEFLHNFGEVLGFDMESLPTLESLQQALMPNEHTYEAEEELFSVMTHLLVCAIEDPGIPNPARHTTILGQSLRQADITHTNLSEILRIYLYANATGEVKALTGVHFERDREKRVADHHQTDDEMQQTLNGKNAHYYELLHENPTYKMSDLLRDKPFIALTPTDKAAILAFICNELLQNKTVLRQIENSLENMIQHKRDKWLLDQKIRKLRVVHNRKIRNEAALEKCHMIKCNNDSGVDDAVSAAGGSGHGGGGASLDSPHTSHKDDLLDDDVVDHEMSDNESVGTQPEEEEDARLSAEELAKKLEKFTQTSENHLHTINLSMSQLRAVTYGEDRYFRRYWSLPKSGGIFVEAMESAEPEEYEEQLKNDQNHTTAIEDGSGGGGGGGIKNLNELNNVVENVDDDHSTDKEVSNIVGKSMDVDHDDDDKESQNHNDNLNQFIDNNEHRKTPNRMITDADADDDDDESNVQSVQIENAAAVSGTLKELKKTIDSILPEEQKVKQEQMEIDETMDKNQFEINDVTASAGDAGVIPSNKKFNLFEKLGQCMERENRSEDDLKADVKAEIKEDLKNEILNELKKVKCDCVKSDTEDNDELKWFSILNKDGITCNEIHLTTGNKWENGNVGACIKDITELKIPIFPPPLITNSSNTGTTTVSCTTSVGTISHGGHNVCGSTSASSSSTTSSTIMNLHHNCESPAPLQMTSEESVQLEYIKKHGMPSVTVKSVPFDKRHGWWRIKRLDQLREILDRFHLRGVREKELKRSFIITMQQMYNKGKLVIEYGVPELISLGGNEHHQQQQQQDERTEEAMDVDNSGAGCEEDERETGAGETNEKVDVDRDYAASSVADGQEKKDDFPLPDQPGSWSQSIAHRVDMFLLEQVEALEDKVANASMQVKGWKVPERDIEDIPYGHVVNLVKSKLSSLEVNIERRYLKPPLGVNTNIRSNQQHQHQQQQQQQQQQQHHDLQSTASFPNNIDLSSSSGTTVVNATPASTAALNSNTASTGTPQSVSTTSNQQLSVSSSTSIPSTPSSTSTSPSPSIQQQHDDIPKGLANWREAVNRAATSAQLAMCLYSLESSIAWDKSIMKAVSEQAEFSIQNARKYNSKLTNCQFCHSGDNEDKLLLCDSCDRGYHTYCFKPKMENIPDGDWYCHECLNKATGERNCIVCGRKISTTSTRLLVCEICPRAYHTDCIQPQLHKVPRGKWYCTNCISKKPQKKANKKKEKSKDGSGCGEASRESNTATVEQSPVSPAASHSSAATSDDAPALTSSLSSTAAPTATMNCSQSSDQSNSSITLNASGSPSTSIIISSPSTITAIVNTPTTTITPSAATSSSSTSSSSSSSSAMATTTTPNYAPKKEKSNKKLMKELAPCRIILEDLECHDDAWPFLLPVNTKQFPTYKKIIKIPMDLSTIKKRLHDLVYKSKEEFCSDVRQIFNNCETFNEDDSPVGKAGHCMRQFFEARWNELCCTSHS